MNFKWNALLSVLALTICTVAHAQGTITVDAAGTVTPVARGFAGLSIETTTSLRAWAGTYDPANPALFNTPLVKLINLLGQYEGSPVIRIGGSTQDTMWFAPDTATRAPAFNYAKAPSLLSITPAQVNTVAWVQRLTGSPFTIGLNMGGNLPSAAVTEMAAFQAAFDPSGIFAYDIGNEPDNGTFGAYRSPGWNESAYQANLLEFLAVLRNAAPTAVFAAPAFASGSWLPPTASADFNALLAAVKGQIGYVTLHHYVNVAVPPPADPVGTLFNVANTSGIAARLATTQAAASAVGLGLRVNEANTYALGGIPGVSDSMVAALWNADSLCSYANAGFLGVNFHWATGSTPYNPVSLTSTTPGFSVSVNPGYYGMMIFSQLIQNDAGMLRVAATSTLPTTADVYATRDGSGALRVLVFNKSQTQAMTATVAFNNLAGKYQSTGNVIFLRAPSLSATTGLTLGGQSYDSAGNVVGTLATTPVPATGGNFSWSVPLGSASLFTLDLQTPVRPTASATLMSGRLVSGAPAVFDAAVTGTAPFSYQWLFNGNAIAGETGHRLVLPAAKTTDAGDYSIRVTNSAGEVTSAPVPLSVNAPAITTQPASVTAASGDTVVFSAAASGSPAPSFQWMRTSGAPGAATPVPIPGATGPTLVLSGSTGSTAALEGTYTVVATNASGVVSSAAARLTSITTPDIGRLTNLSVLTDITSAVSSFTVGTVVGGAGTSGTQSLVVRAAGPSLGALGVPGTIGDPQLTLFTGTTAVATNDNWGGSTALTAAMASVGAFAYTGPTSRDAAIFQQNLAPSGYTVAVSGVGGSVGTALAEIYDATAAGTFTPSAPRLLNVSVLKSIASGGSLTLGFTIGGSAAKTVLIRVIGPGLAAVGLTSGTLGDPQLTLFNSSSQVIASNDDWGGDSQLVSVGQRVGAFSVGTAATKDSMLLVTLPGGGYTARATGGAGSSGLAIVEVYEVP